MAEIFWWLGGLALCFVWLVGLLSEWQADTERDRREAALVQRWIRDSEARWGSFAARGIDDESP